MSDSVMVKKQQALQVGRTSLAHGRTLAVKQGGTELRLSSPNGQVELTVRVTEDGPSLVFDQARVQLENSGDVGIRCQDLEIEARGAMRVNSGDYQQRAAGNYHLNVRDDARFEAQQLELAALLGELSLRANDDVALNGLRVLLNVAGDEDLEARGKAIEDFKEYLKRPFVAPGSPRRLPRSEPKKREDW